MIPGSVDTDRITTFTSGWRLRIRSRHVRPSMPGICVVHGGEGREGVAALALVKTRAPATAVVLLVERADADELIDALRAGASGYILEGGGTAGIGRALQAVRRGEPAIPRELLG